MSQLEEIKARAEKATPGPWKVWGMQVLADPVGDSNLDTALPIADTTDPHRGLRTFNADFIAHARTDVPKLIAALEAICLLTDDAVTTLRHGGGGLALADDINAAIGKALA